jgi:hypothetical protein
MGEFDRSKGSAVVQRREQERARSDVNLHREERVRGSWLVQSQT